ncbi:MAG TPA: SDR family NAD(P)-dependent oxidoreductase [Bacteroidia bacterium]|nr:SDR family NAD(P)-dependent oxidoreductase [Bacteroidia bacterium]
MTMNNYLEEIFSLKGQIAIVTGGAMGIGKGIALSLAKAGAIVLIADIVKPEEAKSTMNELKEIIPACSYMQIDLRNISQLSSLPQKAIDQYGDLNILVNNAGIFKYRPMMDMDESMWDNTVDLNLKSAAFLSREFAKVMEVKGHGARIINITSIDAIKPVAWNLSHYDSSKAALRMFTRSFAKEVASLGILVNDIAPGGVNTPGAKTIGGDNPDPKQLKAMEQQTAAFIQMLPIKRFGEPEDIGHAVVFLAGKAASYITGTSIVIDGGMLIM